MTTASDPALIATLEGLLAPGGRARLSHYVEAAQCEILCGQSPHPQRHHEDMQSILNAADEPIRRIAKVWVGFCDKGKQFTRAYTFREFLDAYLAYYCTTNVAKVQLSLLDLIAKGALTGPSLHVVDIGVGTGTTLLGLMDFLLAWATACDLYGATFPIEAVSFTGLDCAEGNLSYARQVAAAFEGVLRRRRELSTDPEVQARLARIEGWVTDAKWRHHNLNQTPYTDGATNLLIASNVFNELSSQGRQHLGATLAAMPDGGVGIIIEPGAKWNSQELMAWRHRLVGQGSRLTTIGPCGANSGAPVGPACDTCWNSRRESLHEPPLYARFRAYAAELQADDRPFEDEENQLLSWSYILLEAGPPTVKTLAQPITLGSSAPWPASQPLTFIGAYYAPSGTAISEAQPVDQAPDHVGRTRRQWTEIAKFCPATVADSQTLSLRRDHGIQIPRLRYGEGVTVANILCRRAQSGVAQLEAGPGTVFDRAHKPLGIAETFLPEYTPQVRRAVDEIAYRLFGFPRMRPFQHQILGQSLIGRSILGIAATGGGKSECYILPAMLLPGITVVVSPLKSLMMDQYEQRICQRYGLGNLTTIINGDVPFAERQARLRRIELGYYKLVYVTPEQLERSYVLDSLGRADKQVGIRYLALDEAHCISQWGHDFRSSYLNMIQRLRTRGIQPVRIALTATASPEVRQDLCDELQLDPRPLEEGGNLFIESSNRPELNLVVRVCRTTDDKVESILGDLQQLRALNKFNQAPGAAIVFTPYTGGKLEFTAEAGGSERGRRSPGATSFASYLERALQEPVAVYHGKMELDTAEADEDGLSSGATWLPSKPHFGDLSGRSRREEQRAFIKGERSIMVATKGFGMGIDKPNIRWVIHRSPPGNLEAYAQEAGRAGRDGEAATVILYYSPDSPIEEGQFNSKQLPSDDEIQRRFLADKYIRREDVLVMRAFLRSAPRRVEGRIYVTNDEAIAFFDQCRVCPQLAGLSTPYSWPKWQEREPEGRESSEHKQILDTGYEYQQKTNYLKRILDVVYRIRPNVGHGSPREALALEYREVGARLVRPHVKNAEAILTSNAYFGAVLREAGLTPHELRDLLHAGDLLALAARLKQPLSEVALIVSDIKQLQLSATGSTREDLLEYSLITPPHYGPAEGKEDLDAWRVYAGAWRRAKKKEAEKRAKKARRPFINDRQETTLDDWFYWGEVNARLGWEIVPGPALERDQDFSDYLNAFMSLHDSRQRNDWAAYHRLLTDYVGVEANGTIGLQSRNQCLRAVLLGYLKTYEVIVGGSCRSCSRCVPDERFTASSDERKRVVARMNEELERLFGEVESHAEHFPASSLIETLLTAVRREQVAGQSLVAYLQGWSNRVLLDTPTHRGALMIRVASMVSGLMELQRDDLLALIGNIVQLAADDELTVVASLVEQAWNAQPDSHALCRQRATLARRRGRAVDEVQAWEDMLKLLEQRTPIDQGAVFEACAALTDLYAPGLPLYDVHRYHHFALRAARTAKERDIARPFYARTIPSRSWEEVEALSKEEQAVIWPGLEAPLLLNLWLDSDLEGRAAPVADALFQDAFRWEDWPATERRDLAKRLPDSALGAHPSLAMRLVQLFEAPPDVLRLARLAITGGATMTGEIARLVAVAALQIVPADLECLDVLTRQQCGSEVYQTLRKRFRIRSWDNAVWLFTRFEAELLAETAQERLRRLREGISVLPYGESRESAARQLQALAMSILSDPEVGGEAHFLWQQACIGCVNLSLDYLGLSLGHPERAQRAMELLTLLAKSDQATRSVVYVELKRRTTMQDWQTLQRWLDWFTPEICAEPPYERIQLVRSWQPVITPDAPHSKLIAALSPAILPLLGDPAVGDEAHSLWQQICIADPEATASYVTYCDGPLADEQRSEHFLDTLLMSQLELHRALYLLLRPIALKGARLPTFRSWYRRFKIEACAEELSERLSVLQRSIALFLSAGEPTDIPVWLREQAVELIVEAIPTTSWAMIEAEAKQTVAAAQRYALLCMILPGGPNRLAEFTLSLMPVHAAIRRVIYRVERLVELPATWDELAAWISRWSDEICKDDVQTQISIINHTLPLVPISERRASALELLGPLLAALVRDPTLLPESMRTRLQVEIPDLDEIVYRCEDQAIITANVFLLNAWLLRHKPQILAEAPIQRLHALDRYIAGIPPHNALGSTIAEKLQPIAASLFTVDDQEIAAEAHQRWQRVCEKWPPLIQSYIATGLSLPHGQERERFFALLPTTPPWLCALYMALRPTFAPQCWEEFAGWLDRFASIESMLPDEERLELLQLGATLLSTALDRRGAVVKLAVSAREIFRRPSIAVRAHVLWQQDVCGNDADLCVRYIFHSISLPSSEQYNFEWIVARLKTDPEVRTRFHQEMSRQPMRTQENIYALLPGEIDHIPLADQVHLLRAVAAKVRSTRDQASDVMQMLKSFTTLIGTTGDHANEAHQIIQSLCILDASLITKYLDLCANHPNGETYSNNLLDLLILPGQVAKLAQLPKILPFRRWNLAVRMADALISVFGSVGSLQSTEITGETLSRLSRALEPHRNTEYADMLVAALAQIRTWTRPAYLTPLTRQIEALVQAGRCTLARQLAAPHPDLVLGKHREPAAEFISRAESNSQDDRPLNPDYAKIASILLSKGAGC